MSCSAAISWGDTAAARCEHTRISSTGSMASNATKARCGGAMGKCLLLLRGTASNSDRHHVTPEQTSERCKMWGPHQRRQTWCSHTAFTDKVETAKQDIIDGRTRVGHAPATARFSRMAPPRQQHSAQCVRRCVTTLQYDKFTHRTHVGKKQRTGCPQSVENYC